MNEGLIVMKCLIVMQGETYEDERKRSVLEAPTLDRAGAKYFSWEKMKDLRQGDVVFHYVKGWIQAVSVVTKETEVVESMTVPMYRAEAAYTDLDRPLLISQIFDELEPLLPEKYSPFQKDGSGNGGYLFPIHTELALRLIHHLLQDVQDLLIQPTLLEETSNLTVSLLARLTGWKQQLEYQNEAFLKERRVQMIEHQKQCAVCHLSYEALLRAPFLKMPEKGTEVERTSEYNGIVLCHNHSTLFEKGLITVNRKGQLLVSEKIMDYQFALELYEGQSIAIQKQQKKYLQWHATHIFKNK